MEQKWSISCDCICCRALLRFTKEVLTNAMILLLNAQHNLFHLALASARRFFQDAEDKMKGKRMIPPFQSFTKHIYSPRYYR